jgi:hypothetical protein
VAFEDGKYRAGGFAVPGGTGNFSVTGIDFDVGCQGVMFFGSNQTTEDAVVSTANAGVFMGLMAQEDGGGILAQANSIIPLVFQQSRGSHPIFQIADTTTIDYSATPVSLNADGFTVNFDAIPGSARWIHYLAWGDWDDADTNRPSPGGTTVALGWLAGAMFMAGTYSPGGNGDWDSIGLGGYHFGWWGGAVYPLNTIGWNSGYLSLCGPGAGSTRHTRLLTSPPTTAVNFGFSFIGPFLAESLHHAYPTGVGNLDFYDDSPGQDNYDLYAYWNGDGNCTNGTPAASSPDTVTVPLSQIDTADAIVFFGACGQEGGPGSEFNGTAISFGVVTPPTLSDPGYQGCVAVDEGGDFFQSRTKSWCSSVRVTGAHAGTTELPVGTANFVWTTDDDDVSPQNLVAVVYGHGGGFIPQIYRRIPILSPPR